MELPKGPRDVKRVNPKKLIIFGKPKCGKTRVTADLTLDGKWALLELENEGADFVQATVLEAKTLDELKTTGQAIRDANFPYEGIIVDTVTKLEEMIMPLAASKYKAQPMGVNWTGTDVRTLPKGAGYLYMRQAFFEVLNYIATWADNIIFLGHLSDKMIEKKGEEVNSKELDLTGKISALTCADADAIAYCYRKDNKTILSFGASEDQTVGSRAAHLSKGKEIVIAESDEEGNITTHWDRVYI